MNLWDQNFSIDGHKYGTAPNAFLAAQAARLTPGSEVLVPGDGEGRNGVWLASQGHRVTSMDGSVVGLRKAQALAESRGVTLQTVLGDLRDWTPPPASADAVVLIYVHLPADFRRDAHRRLAAALRPGGWLVLEAFEPRQLERRSGGPKDVSMLLPLATVREDFAGLLDEHLGRSEEVALDEGPGHQGPAFVTRWVGRRP